MNMRHIIKLGLLAAFILTTATIAPSDAQQRLSNKNSTNGNTGSKNLCGPRAIHYRDHQGCIAYQVMVL
jgi:hypothetical protein